MTALKDAAIDIVGKKKCGENKKMQNYHTRTNT